jgi:galactokinase
MHPPRSSSGRTAELRQRFRDFAGREGQLAFAPGRLNLIGEHTDYTGGFVLPASLAIGTWAIAAPRTDDVVHVFSETQDELASFPLDVDRTQVRGHWSDYIAGVTWSLQRAGATLRGADLYVASDLPIGAGLSSSAALEVATAHALLAIADLAMSPLDIARACCLAENEYVGARCGIMDQFAATHGRKDWALLLDCASLESKAVPLPDGHRWIVANTMVRHALAHGEYNVRRGECEQILDLAMRRFPDLARLRELSPGRCVTLAHELPAHLARRLRHIVAENQRVLDAVRALESGEVSALGRLLLESHASLRSDFEVSCFELDLMVDLAMQSRGVAGARMIGGGFGGCTVSLVEATRAEDVVDALGSKYAQATGMTPAIFICDFGDAAGVSP